jgi:hypothetical protein
MAHPARAAAPAAAKGLENLLAVVVERTQEHPPRKAVEALALSASGVARLRNVTEGQHTLRTVIGTKQLKGLAPPWVPDRGYRPSAQRRQGSASTRSTSSPVSSSTAVYPR